MPKMTASEVQALLQSERTASLTAEDASKLSDDRASAMDYYLGDMEDDMPSQPDRSSAVSTDVADTIEGILPSLVEIFLSGDEVVNFVPTNQQDVKAAQQETEYVNHVIMDKNSGFIQLYSFFKDALLQKNGFIKVWWEEILDEEEENYRGLTDGELAMLMQDDEIEIVEQKTYLEGQDPDAMEPAELGKDKSEGPDEDKSEGAYP